MTSAPGKAPKKEKEKKQTPEERARALRYNHMMYGPTAKEVRPAAKKVNYGASYLQHPKFQALIEAFKKGGASQFEVVDKGKTCTIATDGTQILFNGRMLFYSRFLNRYEENLLLDRAAALHFQFQDACVHLVFAVIRSFPELEAPALGYQNHQFYLGAETLDVGIEAQGPNLLLGAFRHQKPQDKPKL